VKGAALDVGTKMERSNLFPRFGAHCAIAAGGLGFLGDGTLKKRG
jgi:hypothetical protein